MNEMSTKFQLTADNYYSDEANREYLSVSQFKDFAGTCGKQACEFTALEKLKGKWKPEKTTPLLIGSYVDSYFEGTLEKFKNENPEVFTKAGDLKANFKHAEEIIARIERDPMFMKYMSGQKQVIMTGEIFGAKWKIKMDSYIPRKAIVDLKVVKAVDGKDSVNWVRDSGYVPWFLYWGYDIQGAIYQEIVRQNTGDKLPFYLAATSKQNEPSIRIVQLMQRELDEALSFVQSRMPRILRLKNNEDEPDRCEVCECCRHTRILSKPICSTDILNTAGV